MTRHPSRPVLGAAVLYLSCANDTRCTAVVFCVPTDFVYTLHGLKNGPCVVISAPAKHNVFVVWMNPVLLRRSQIVAASVMSETHHIVAQCMITESIAAEHNIASSKNHTVFFRTPRSMPLHTNHPALHVAALRLL